MRIAAIADVHFAVGPLGACGERRTAIADILLARAIRRINRFIKPDLTILLGDMLDNGDGPNAQAGHEHIAGIISKLESPWLIIPGNHDGDVERFYSVYCPDAEAPACTPSSQEGDRGRSASSDLSPGPSPKEGGEQFIDIAGVRFLTFLDPEVPGYNAVRRDDDIARMGAARQGFDGPIVSVQHIPLFLPGTCDSPYKYENLPAVWDAFERNNFSLALSGHWHKGDDLISRGAGPAVIVPGLCEAPFAFMEITIEGDKVSTRRHELALPEGMNLIDYHVHTPFAYCSENMDNALSLALAREFGLAGLAFTEHSGQLYFDRDTFWGARFIADGIDTIEGRQDQMTDYMSVMADFLSSCPPLRRGDYRGVPGEDLPLTPSLARRGDTPDTSEIAVCLGLEIDCDNSGRPVVRKEDWDRLQVRVGSIHWLQELRKPAPDLSLAADEMLGRLEKFLQSGIHILAHPLRVFRAYPDLPPKLIPGIMELLRKNDVAAEINFHVQLTSPEFLRACLDNGVRIVFGSDSHNLSEIGDFWPHLELLKQCGTNTTALADTLAYPPSS